MHDGSTLARTPAGPAAGTATVLLALAAGALVAGASLLGTTLQTALVLALGAGVPALVVFIARPSLALAGYLLTIPLVLPYPVAMGLNAGETLTLCIMTFGSLSLWEAQDRVRPALRALRGVLLPLVGLAVVSVVSVLVNGIASFEEVVSALFKVLAFAVVAILVHIHANTEGRTRTMLLAALAGGACVAVHAVIAYMLGWSFEHFEVFRASGTFEHWNALGGFMALMSMPTLALAISTRNAAARMGCAIAFVLQITAMLLSQTLGSILALIIAIGFALVFLVRISWGRLLSAGVLMTLAFGLGFATNQGLRDKLSQIDERVIDRLSTYAVGVSMFRDKFWFGFGSEQRLLDELWFGEADYGITIFGQSSSIPHNSFLRIGVEKGVFGVVLFTLLIIGALRILLRDRALLQRGPFGWLYTGLVIGMLAFLVQNMTNDLVLHARMGIVFFSLVALVARLREHSLAAEGG